MKKAFLLISISSSLLFRVKINAQSIIAQVNTYNSGIAIECVNTDEPPDPAINISVGQTFKSLLTTTISTVQFNVYNVISSGTVNLEIYSCSAPTSWGSLLGTVSNISVSTSGWIATDVSSLNISVTAGNYYGFRIVPNLGFDANMKIDNNVYADGGLWTSNFAFGNPDDMTFIVSSNASLPVKLISFTAQKQNNKALLQWSTASEQDSKDFIIQHSMDGSQWNAIGTIAAQGNSSTVTNYSYTDMAPAVGTNYYRLLQTDIDGKSTYSEIRMVKFTNDDKAFFIITNPVSSGELKVQVNETMIMGLYDFWGRLLWKEQLTTGIQNINVGNYPAGIYFIKAKGKVEKVLVQ